MNILICVSDNRIRPALVLMCSICKNNPKTNINLHIVANNLSDGNRNLIDKLAERLGTINLSYIDLPIEGEIPDSDLVLQVQNVVVNMSDEVEKLLYLDVNSLVTGDITKLWNTELDGFAMAVCRDANVYINELENEYLGKTGIDKSFVWFSTAVMLINVKYWRRRHIDLLIWDSYKENQYRENLSVQQIFNRNLCDKIRYVSWGRYCVPTCFYRLDLKAVVDGNIEFASYEQINTHGNVAEYIESHVDITERVIQNACIITYCNDESRPWKHAGVDVYWVYRLYHSTWFEYENMMLKYLN